MTNHIIDDLLASLNRSMVRSDELSRAAKLDQETFTKILQIVVPRSKPEAITAQRDAQHDFQKVRDLCVEAKARAPHDGVSP